MKRLQQEHFFQDCIRIRAFFSIISCIINMVKDCKNTVVKNTGVCLGIYSTSYHHRLKCFKLSTFDHMKCEKKIQCKG